MPSSVSTISSKFQSTLSVRRATGFSCALVRSALISIHALREESDRHPADADACRIISIHALREESDRTIAGQRGIRYHFNPRSP